MKFRYEHRFCTHLDNCLHLSLGTFLLHNQCRHSPLYRNPVFCVATLTESKSTYVSDILVSIIHTMDPNAGSGSRGQDVRQHISPMNNTNLLITYLSGT